MRATVERGDTVALISPCGPSPEAHILAGAARLSARYRVRLDARALLRRGYLAGDDRQRAAALIEALEDPSVRAVVCTRGGFGATRLLESHADEIERALRADPKPIVGFSDVTALHALWQRVGVRSVHGPMVSRIGTDDAVDDASLARLFAAIEGSTPPMEATRLCVGRSFRGRAAGGNLAVLAALAGTPSLPDFTGRVIFLEDVGERPYRVDRMLTQLRACGALSDVAGVVLGDWLDCAPGPDATTIEDVLLDGLRPLGVPVVVGAPIGHGSRNDAFELGIEVEVDDDARMRWVREL